MANSKDPDKAAILVFVPYVVLFVLLHLVDPVWRCGRDGTVD